MIYRDRIYGDIEINDPLVLELLQSPELERLNKIYANGIYFYFYPKVDVTKLEHSVGVWYLLKKLGASDNEQIAGLLHDVSHKVFAHVIDYLYGSASTEDHQDSIHPDFLKQGTIKEILKKYELTSEGMGNLKKWNLLDKELPNLCADRLDYTLRDSFPIGFSNKELIQEILNDLIIVKNQICLKSMAVAKKLGRLSLKMQNEYWHTEWGDYSYHLMANIMGYALQKKYISEQDLWMGDKQMIDKLLETKDDSIKNNLSLIKEVRDIPITGTRKNHDL